MNRTTLSNRPLKKYFFSQEASHKWSKMAIANEVIAVLLILLFAYAAINKILDYEAFVAQIAHSPTLVGVSKLFAILIPAIELITCLALIIPKFRLIGLYLSFGLMLAFTIYIAAILTFSTKLPCSCGGIIDQLGWPSHLLFNSFFVIISFLGIRLEKKLRKISSVQ